MIDQNHLSLETKKKKIINMLTPNFWCLTDMSSGFICNLFSFKLNSEQEKLVGEFCM